MLQLVYDLADDRLWWLVASGLGARMRPFQARPRKPEGREQNTGSVDQWVRFTGESLKLQRKLGVEDLMSCPELHRSTQGVYHHLVSTM